MVDVAAKPATVRTATARGVVQMSAAAFRALREHSGPKGDALATARIAGIQAAKSTSVLIPLCHPLPLTSVAVAFALKARPRSVEVQATVRCTGPTGVEMEALAAVSVACLTIYDMLKALDKGMVIGPIVLIEKTGGKSGTYRRGSEAA